jgi:hypothetical protein
MAERTPQELRHLARGFREMAVTGGDESLKAALIELAAEFEKEAEKVEAATPNPYPRCV